MEPFDVHILFMSEMLFQCPFYWAGLWNQISQNGHFAFKVFQCPFYWAGLWN